MPNKLSYKKIRISGSKPVLNSIKIKIPSGIELIEAVEEGLPAKFYSTIQKEIGLSNAEIAKILGVSIRYLKDKKQTDQLNTKASERLVKLYELWNFGLDTFDGNAENFKEWLRAPLVVLHGKTPLNLMKNLIGMEMIKELLGRIEHGVYS